MIQPKRILILNWRCPHNPLAGGAEMITLKHAQAWVQAGYEVYWFAERFDGSASEEVIDGIHIVRLATANKMHSFTAPFYYVNLLSHNIFTYWFRFKGAFDLVIDEVHGPSMWITFWALRSKKLIYVHEVAQDIWDKMLPWPLSIMGKFAEHVMYVFYKNLPFLTASESTKNDLIRYGIPSANITLIPHGIDLTPLQKVTKKESKLTLIFVARLVKMKGIEETLRVMKHVVELMPNAQLWIVGKGDKEYLEVLHGLVSDLGIARNCTFLGYVDTDKQIKLYQKAHFLIHTSVREGFGLVVIEANSQGTPAFVYDSPGLRDLVKKGFNGDVVSYGHADTLAKKIVQTYSHDAMYSRMALNSINFSKKFDWGTITDRSLEHVTLLLKTK